MLSQVKIDQAAFAHSSFLSWFVFENILKIWKNIDIWFRIDDVIFGWSHVWAAEHQPEHWALSWAGRCTAAVSWRPMAGKWIINPHFSEGCWRIVRREAAGIQGDFFILWQVGGKIILRGRWRSYKNILLELKETARKDMQWREDFRTLYV